MDKVLQANPNLEGRGKAYAVSASGNLVLIDPSTELRPGWRWATEADVKIAHGVAAILKAEPDAPIDQVREHVTSVMEFATSANEAPAPSPIMEMTAE